MLLKNSIKWPIFLNLTLLNLIQVIFFVGYENLNTILVLLGTILVNQYCLFIVVADMTGIEKNTSLLPTWLAGMLKILLLIAGFYVAVSKLPSDVINLVLTYIFQLIILAISIKRVVKKN